MKWHVWEAEYPEDGSMLFDAEDGAAAMKLYEELTGESGTELDVVFCGESCPCKEAAAAEEAA